MPTRNGHRPMKSDAWGIDARYEDAAGKMQRVPHAVIEDIRGVMGKPPGRARSLFGEPVIIVPQGQSVPLPSAAQLIQEDGRAIEVPDRLPADLPIGYHHLTSVKRPEKTIRIIVTPTRCHLPEGLRIWGWNAQLYATRSRASWGMGDLGDLRRLNGWAHELGAGMLLINPLHAVAPIVPQEASPYSPSSRRFLNPLYLRVEEMPGAAHLGAELQRLARMGQALNEERRIDRDRIFRLKQDAFELLWGRFESDPAFDDFRRHAGNPLRQFAVYCVLSERHGADWREWPSFYRRPDSPEVQRFAEAEAERVRFHEWLQWLTMEQLARAAHPVPLLQDLPIGFSPGGADAWIWQNLIAQGVTVGAPPDLHNKDGQDWGLPPFIPYKLRAAGYEPFIQTIRAVLRHAGGLRIDHVMGLFRLWWVPQGRSPKEGAYVRYPVDDLLAILAIESHRAGAIVVGEDLGTVEEGVREKLADHNVLSYRLLWFEDQPPSAYPEKALASVTTHDLPTLAGIWTGADVEAQERAGVTPDREADAEFKRKLTDTSGLEPDADVISAITATFERLAEAPSVIVLADLEAACGVPDRPNMPSAVGGQYPNWSIALPMPLEKIESADLPRRLARTMTEGRAAGIAPHSSAHVSAR